MTPFNERANPPTSPAKQQIINVRLFYSVMLQRGAAEVAFNHKYIKKLAENMPLAGSVYIMLHMICDAMFLLLNVSFKLLLSCCLLSWPISSMY